MEKEERAGRTVEENRAAMQRMVTLLPESLDSLVRRGPSLEALACRLETSFCLLRV